MVDLVLSLVLVIHLRPDASVPLEVLVAEGGFPHAVLHEHNLHELFLSEAS